VGNELGCKGVSPMKKKILFQDSVYAWQEKLLHCHYKDQLANAFSHSKLALQ
jgi:hypothetical protein